MRNHKKCPKDFLGHFCQILGQIRGKNGANFAVLTLFQPCFCLLPIKNNLAGSAATHDIEAFLEVVDLVVMGDDWRQI